MKKLKQHYGDWALVTGASSGIGQEFARQLAALEFNLVLVARRQNELDALAQELSQKHPIKTRVVAADLTKTGSVQSVYDAVTDLDIGLLIPCAGIDEMGEFLDKDYASLDRMLTLNIAAPTELSHRFGQRMKARGKKSGIILVSSLFAYQGIPFFATYAASKSYVLGLGEALHEEFKQHGIDVLTLSPGLTATPFAQGLELNPALLPMIAQNPATVARLGLKKLGKKMSVVSGLLNKFYAWENRLIPRSWPVKLFGFLIANSNRSYRRKLAKA